MFAERSGPADHQRRAGRTGHTGRASRTLVLPLALLLAACSGVPPVAPATTSEASLEPSIPATVPPAGPVSGWDPPLGVSLAEAAFGVAAPSDGSVTYQRDVVLVGGGGAMVRSVSDDSLTWTIDRAAPGIDQLELGKVMVLTGMVAGRVLALADGPLGIDVMLGPVDFSDVIRDGHFEASMPLNLDDATIVLFPDAPNAIELTDTPDEGAFEQGTAVASLRLPTTPSFAGPRGQIARPIDGGTVEAGVGPFAVKLKSGGLEVTYSRNGVDIVLEFGAIMNNPSVDFALDMVAGKPTNGRLLVKGIEGFSVRMKAGSETGLAGNFKARVELPFSYVIPLYPPFYLNLTHKFFIQPIFTARSSFLTDEAQYDLDGDLGWTMAGGEITLVTPTVSPTVPALEQLEAISLGVNGIVFAYQLKARAAVGTPILNAGPFAAATISLGLTVGSDAGIGGVKCHQATATLTLDGGVGYGWASGGIDQIKSFLGKLGIDSDKAKFESEWTTVSKGLYSVATWEPDVPVCSLAG